MPIDVDAAVGAVIEDRTLTWSASDVLRYHLALGAGQDPSDPRELRYVWENVLHVLPTFAAVAGRTDATEPPTLDIPGIEVNQEAVLHGEQQVVVHRPLTTNGSARAISRVAAIYDKVVAAVLVVETTVFDHDSTPWWTTISSRFMRGEGGFGGHRGPAAPDRDARRTPDEVITSTSLPQQALWYRLLGDRNPLHCDPVAAQRAGFRSPILHGMATYGIVAKAVIDTLLNGETARMASYTARFTGIVYPGETLRTQVTRSPGSLHLETYVCERDAPAVLSASLLHT